MVSLTQMTVMALPRGNMIQKLAVAVLNLFAHVPFQASVEAAFLIGGTSAVGGTDLRRPQHLGEGVGAFWPNTGAGTSFGGAVHWRRALLIRLAAVKRTFRGLAPMDARCVVRRSRVNKARANLTVNSHRMTVNLSLVRVNSSVRVS